MAKKRRSADASTSAPEAVIVEPAFVPLQPDRPVLAVTLLAATLLLAPALGVPSELLLQDTLKSIVVAFGALLSALALLLHLRRQPRPVAWHAVVVLPLLLMAYALGSMAWSHTYLAAVEAIRWALFALIVAVAANTFTRASLPRVAAAVHLGAVLASLWAALQFWVDWRFFAQGPNPASTFVNRNFFAEYAVCTLPFSAAVLTRAQGGRNTVTAAAGLALIVLAILMTGTRSALISLWTLLLVITPLAAWRFRSLAGAAWPVRKCAIAAGVVLGLVATLGNLPTTNERIETEGRGNTPLARGLMRTASIQPGDSSLQLRKQMWNAALRAIADKPLTGVGAGAWEVHIPLYQGDGEQLETDYYAHNEVLQLLAEDGAVGALFLVGLFAYLLVSGWRTWRLGAHGEAPWRVVALASLLALMVVSNAGFPWRMAATGALFATSLGWVAASDLRLGIAPRWATARAGWRAAWTWPAIAACSGALALATLISVRAAQCEARIVRATQLALSISESGHWNDARWTQARRDVLRLTREAIAINPHYRKITPIVGDELSRWGDWTNATWIWESVLDSRPYVVALLTNAARGHAAQDDPAPAFEYLERARQIAPRAPSVTSLEVILLSRFRDARAALPIARAALAEGRYDYDLVYNAFLLAWRAGDHQLAEDAMRLRLRDFPESRAEAFLQWGHYLREEDKDEAGAIDAWRQGLAMVPANGRPSWLRQVPPEYRDRVAAP